MCSNEWICEHPGCRTCGKEKGCGHAASTDTDPADSTSQMECAPWCSELSCWAPACVGCFVVSCRDEPLQDLAQYWAEGNQLFTNAFRSEGFTGNRQELLLKGISWHGLEQEQCAVGGLLSAPLDDYATFLKQSGFNAVLVPLAADLITSEAHGAGAGCTAPASTYNPEYTGLKYTDQIERLVTTLRNAGLLVMLQLHGLSAGDTIGGVPHLDDLLKHGDRTKQLLMSSWDLLAIRFCDSSKFWNVFGADLKGSPWGMRWGAPKTGLPLTTDDSEGWAALAASIGGVVHAACPRWVVAVEALVADSERAAGGSPWDSDLSVARTQPVRLLDRSPAGEIDVSSRKVIYSPTSYGPAVRGMDGGGTRTQDELWAQWDSLFGRLASSGTAALVVGAWGGSLAEADGAWQRSFSSYLASRPFAGSFYLAMNPEVQVAGSRDGLPQEGLLKSWRPPLEVDLSSEWDLRGSEWDLSGI